MPAACGGQCGRSAGRGGVESAQRSCRQPVACAKRPQHAVQPAACNADAARSLDSSTECNTDHVADRSTAHLRSCGELRDRDANHPIHLLHPQASQRLGDQEVAAGWKGGGVDRRRGCGGGGGQRASGRWGGVGGLPRLCPARRRFEERRGPSPLPSLVGGVDPPLLCYCSSTAVDCIRIPGRVSGAKNKFPILTEQTSAIRAIYYWASPAAGAALWLRPVPSALRRPAPRQPQRARSLTLHLKRRAGRRPLDATSAPPPPGP
jgi:hypothetical protein